MEWKAEFENYKIRVVSSGEQVKLYVDDKLQDASMELYREEPLVGWIDDHYIEAAALRPSGFRISVNGKPLEVIPIDF